MKPTSTPRPAHTAARSLPRRLRWLQPLLALAGLGGLAPTASAHVPAVVPAVVPAAVPTAVPTAVPVDVTIDLKTDVPQSAPAIERVQQLRARLLALDARLADASAAQPGHSPPDEQVAQWKKWNDWNNWNNWTDWSKWNKV